jgi:hypothetical protein
VNILQAIADPKVFAGHFRGSTWDAWRVFLAALFGLPMTAEQLAIYQKHTGRSTPPSAPSLEAWLCIGRRGGKSFALAVIATFLACFRDWRPFLGPGEAATVMVICADRKQARTIMRFALGLLKAVPMLRRQIVNVTRESITLKHRVVIEVHTASFKTTRGYTIVAALCDEIAYWPTDENASDPDTEVLNALKPAMATVPGALLLCASSPYSRRGALWDAHRKHYGEDSDVLVWQAGTRDMNSTVPQSYIDRHLADDPARAAAEYLATFRSDIERFVSLDVIEAAVIQGRHELPRAEGIKYYSFVDPSGGSSDSMTLAVCHMAGTRVIVDLIREVRAPFSPDSVVKEFSDVLRLSGVATVVGDRYASQWPRERFKVHGIEYRVSDKVKSDLYLHLLPLLNSGRVELLDHPRLISQLTGLERRTSRAGRDLIDHPPGAFDDVANCVAGAAALAAQAAAHPAPKIVSPLVWSKNAGWLGDAVPGSNKSATQLFYESGYAYSRDPFAREW